MNEIEVKGIITETGLRETVKAICRKGESPNDCNGLISFTKVGNTLFGISRDGCLISLSSKKSIE